MHVRVHFQLTISLADVLLLSGFKFAQVELSAYHFVLAFTLTGCLTTSCRGRALRSSATFQIRAHRKEDFLELCSRAVSECRVGRSGTAIEGISLAHVDR